MNREIRISKNSAHKGDDGHKVVSVRMKDETTARLDELSVRTNRSRNELINMCLEAALDIVTVTSDNDPKCRGRPCKTNGF